MKFIKEIKFRNSDTADISSLVDFTLGLYNYSNEMKIRYSFIFEETLLEWQELYGPDAEVTFARYENRYFFRMVISIPGKKHNTLTDNTSEDVLEALVPRMKTGLGYEISYRYRNGENRVILTLPKKNVEQSLFYKNLLYTSYPIVIQRRLLSISTIADTLMLSFYSQNAMTSASLVSALTLLFTAFMMAFSSGMTSIFPQYKSKRDFDGAGKTFVLTLKGAMTLGVVFTAVGLFFSEPVLSVYTNVPEIRVLGAEYLKTISLYFLFTSASEVFLCYMRNTGAIIRSSLYVIISQILNCLLNGVFIFGLFGVPEMGIKGAALSTVISSVLLFCMTFGYFLRTKLIRLKPMWFAQTEKSFFKYWLGITFPLLFRELLWYGGQNVISAILGHTNSDVLAANAIAVIVLNLFNCFYGGIASGCELLMVNTLGMRNFDKAARSGRYIIRISTVLGLFKAIVFALCIPIVPFFFGDTTPEASYWLRILLIISTVRYFCAFFNTTGNNGMLLAGGDTNMLIAIETFVIWGLIVLPSLLGMTVFNFPVTVIVLLAYSDEILIFPFDHLRCLSNKWIEKAKKDAI